jgi:hypothetical protein
MTRSIPMNYRHDAPANLDPLPPAESAPRYVEYMGGADRRRTTMRKVVRHPLVRCLAFALGAGSITAAAQQLPPTPAPVLGPNAVPTDPALGPNAIPTSPALAPDQTNPAPVLGPGAIQPDPALGPNAVPDSPALAPDQTSPAPVLAPVPSDSLAPLPPIFPGTNQ